MEGIKDELLSPIWDFETIGYGDGVLVCPTCGKPILASIIKNGKLEPVSEDICYYCGQKFDWNSQNK